MNQLGTQPESNITCPFSNIYNSFLFYFILFYLLITIIFITFLRQEKRKYTWKRIKPARDWTVSYTCLCAKSLRGKGGTIPHATLKRFNLRPRIFSCQMRQHLHRWISLFNRHVSHLLSFASLCLHLLAHNPF